ncbi:glycosyltransferase family 25 protein [Ancylobacter sp. 6x-1]|uniref:Glycosyltransferase family 25 protein n=1 Tax=Ancylobacter crimeensis TaxID=2579147 RepID=A0ABT0DA69_9HYPH|nr:glycosyltransferase family 25 protein [Ancylobacter crimeensis]MCK0196851.1 glycosyltransferase family 25 protein [Ancylobacter crimeensis]
MKCYLINLDRSPERLAVMRARFGALGLGFERVPAIDGVRTELPPAFFLKPDGSVRRPLAPSELGCFYSHYECWQRIAAGEDPYGAIFEDDVVFAQGAAALLADDGWIPAGTDGVKIETMFQQALIDRHAVPLPGGFSLARLLHEHYGAAAYILSRDFAVHLVAHFATPTMPNDHVVFGPEAGFLETRRILQLTPAVAIQERLLEKPTPDEAGSLLEIERMGAGAVSARKGLRRVLRNLSRPVEELVRRLQGRPRGYRGKPPSFARCAVIPFGTLRRRPR